VKKPLVILALAAAVLSACGGDAVVATVGDTEILESNVASLLQDAGAIPNDQFAQELLDAIVEMVVIDAAQTEFGLSFSDEQVEARRTQIQSEIETATGLEYQEFLDGGYLQGQTPPEGWVVGRTDDWLRRIARQQLVAEEVEAALVASADPITADELQDEYDKQLYALTNACVSHILVPTEEEANAVKQRLDDGEDFATVAAEEGTDGTAESGGDLGCTTLDRYVPEFAQGVIDANLNEPTAPVQSQFGYHIVLVRERTTTPFEEVEADLRAQVEAVRSSTLLQDWLLGVLGDAEVSIGEQYGTWTVNPFPQVLPPE
jgi:parvulin-like peptidyl-prolyl isomerase